MSSSVLRNSDDTTPAIRQLRLQEAAAAKSGNDLSSALGFPFLGGAGSGSDDFLVLKSDYAGNLAAAIASNPTAAITLWITEQTTLAQDIPANIQIRFDAAGSFIAGSGTYTINNVGYLDPNTRYFSGAANILLGQYATEGVVHLQWWAAPRIGATSDDNHAIDQAFSSLPNGGLLRVGESRWYVIDKEIPNFVRIVGVGNDPDAAKGTVFYPSNNASASSCFKFNVNYRECGIELATITVKDSTTAMCLAFLGDGATSSGNGAMLRNVYFHGYNYSGTEATARARPLVLVNQNIAVWNEQVNITFDQCGWNFGGHNTPMIRTLSANQSIVFEQPRALIGPGCDFFDFYISGFVTINNYDARGVGDTGWTTTSNRSLTVTTTNGNRQISTSSSFSEDDIGEPIIGTGFNTHITKIVDQTHAMVNVAPSSSGTASATIYRWVSPTAWARSVINVTGTHTNITVTGGADEGFDYVLRYNTAEQNGIVDITGITGQAKIAFIIGLGHVNLRGNYLPAQCIEDDGAVILSAIGNVFKNNTVYGKYIEKTSMWRRRGGSLLVQDSNSYSDRVIDSSSDTYHITNDLNYLPRSIHRANDGSLSSAAVGNSVLHDFLHGSSQAILSRYGICDPVTGNFAQGWAFRYNSGTDDFEVISTSGTAANAKALRVFANIVADPTAGGGLGGAYARITNDATATDFVASRKLLSGGVGSGAGIGYDTGAGGVVTQATSKATAITLDKLCGNITMHNASLASLTPVSFVFNNSFLAGNEVIAINHTSGGTVGNYIPAASVTGSGVAKITLFNATAGALSDAVQLEFVVIRAVTT